MKVLVIGSALLLCATAWAAKPSAKAPKLPVKLTPAAAKAAVSDYLGQVPGGWQVSLSRYREDIKKKGTVITVGGYKKLPANRYLWNAISNKRLDPDYEEPGKMLFRVFEGAVVKRKSGKVEAWRFPTFEEWMQTGGPD